MRYFTLAVVLSALIIGCNTPNYEQPLEMDLTVGFAGSVETVVTPAGDSIQALPIFLSKPVKLVRSIEETKDYQGIYLYPVDAVSKLNPVTKVRITFVTEAMATSMPLLRVIEVSEVK